MKRSGFVVFASAGLFAAFGRAADATSPVDYTQRNAPFAPAGTVQPDKRTPARNDSLQEKRVTPPTVTKKPAAVGDRRAAIDVTEQHEKNVQEKHVRAPQKVETPKSQFDHQRARISTAAATEKPPLVAKYQDSLAAASASNLARFPAVSGAATAKINRFIFRKNGSELVDAPSRASVTPAAGGSAPIK